MLFRSISILLLLSLTAFGQAFTPRRPFILQSSAQVVIPNLNAIMFRWPLQNISTNGSLYLSNSMSQSGPSWFPAALNASTSDHAGSGPSLANGYSNSVYFVYDFRSIGQVDFISAWPNNTIEGCIAWWMYKTNAYNDGIGEMILSKDFPQQANYHNFVALKNAGGTSLFGWYLYGVSDQYITVSTVSNLYPQNAWTHYALVWTSTNHILYLNGTNYASRTVNSTYGADPIGNPPLFLIGGTTGGSRYFDGALSDVIWWTNRLEPSDVNYLYHTYYGMP